MEAKDVTFEVPWDILDASHGFAIDMGGSVLKLIYLDKKDWVEPSKRTTSHGKLKLKPFTHKEFNAGNAYKFIRENVNIIPRADKKQPKVASTGYMVSFNGAAMNKEIGVSIECLMETDCFVQALHFTLKNLPRKDVLYKVDSEEVKAVQTNCKMMFETYKNTWLNSPMLRTGDYSKLDFDACFEVGSKLDNEPFTKDKDMFPCLLAMCGSAFGFMPVYEDVTYGWSDISNRGGRMWLGLGSLLTGGSSYDELMELVESGNHANVDITINDIMADEKHKEQSEESSVYDLSGLADLGDFTAFNMGKTVFKKLGDFKKQDLAKGLLQMIVGDLVTTAHAAAKLDNCKNVFFSGGFVEHPITRSLIYKEFRIVDMESRVFGQSTEPIRCNFLKGGQFYGAFGSLLNHKLKFHEMKEPTEEAPGEDKKPSPEEDKKL